MASSINPSVTHPCFDEYAKKVEMCEDAFSGCVAEYVETLDSQTKKEKADYVNRAAYFGVVQPTVTALIGALTRKDYILTGEFPATDFADPHAFIQYNYKNLLLAARTVMLVTVVDGKSKVATYDGDDVINWSDDFVVIEESALVRDADNPFQLVPMCTYRELYLDDAGFYRSRRWTEGKKGWEFVQLEDMLVNGKLLDYLPIYVATPYDNSFECYTPPLFTQAGQNIQHFKQMCDLTHYSHFMALPTPVLKGDLYNYQQDGETVTRSKIMIGSASHVTHIDKDSEFAWAEVSGSSFSMLQSELKNIEERMFVSGSRLLTVKKGVESVEALQLRSGSESATLETLATSLEAALGSVFELCSIIDRTTISIKLNRDFTAAVTDPTEVAALLQLYSAGIITLDQLQNKLLAGEVVQPATGAPATGQPSVADDALPTDGAAESVS